jgi:hypothetical protein
MLHPFLLPFPAPPFFASLPPPFLFPPPPSISKCPAFSPSIFSVFAVSPAENFLVIFCSFTRLAFLGATVRAPFLVIPDLEECDWEGLEVLDGLVLIAPWAIAEIKE